MITRRNWLLRCSILINVAVLLYVCSQVMIDTNDTSTSSGGGSSSANDAATFGGGGGAVQPVFAKLQALRMADGDSAGLKPDNGRDLLQNFEAGAEREERNGGNGVDADAEQLQQQQQQTQQQQQQQQHIEGVVVDGEENRFEVPSDSEHPDAAAVAVVGAISDGQTAAIVGPVDPVDSNDGTLAQTVDADAAAAASAAASLAAAAAVAPPAESELETRLQQLIECHNKEYVSETVQRGDFWVLKNYIPAEHGELRCFETVTYTTHADYTFLDNLIPLLQRWQAPVSIAMHAPGTDFAPTIRSIRYLRDCAPHSDLVRRYATFHIYFSSKHIPKHVPHKGKALDTLAARPFNCSLPPAYANVSAAQLYKTQKKLLYPVNVGRNVARDAALTHFILASDIELYPNPGLAHKFLDMVARNDAPLRRSNPKVFPLSIFEVDAGSQVPRDKTELLALLKAGKAIPFHKRVCASCHGVPKSKEWMATNETDELGIFHIGKRVGYFVHWEPIYIGTHADPHYDERLSWEGKSDKMTQGYALCALDYEFQILDNAFLVHKPGIKVLKKDTKRAMLAAKTNQLIRKIIYPELQVMYGTRKGCTV